VIIKLTVGELKALLKYEMGPFGEKGFLQFMAGMCVRIDRDTGVLDIDLEDLKIMQDYRISGHRLVIDAIFERSVKDAKRKFLGE
jgi:hypothetical protein